ncbi:SelB C-terminal domain-containing protein [Microbispora sp. RL4-1S]|uniref:SelB C-terminal domain-containing protein n=1 Tax=Microbispora oryzae TaxID=2806554 RepID=A0A940WVS0_9ACTN|nr:selenocysteine-specific translation elongation factor [Microbispora oryzae]MBP2708156.1 SelB C-terminal domain-containing protein [Microbispora oryzae]
MHVVATAGHVDHGKSTLVRALTGMEPDRLEEERRRGLTIELGYAWTTLPSGERVAFVDVPGHERFLGTMLAGVGPVPAVMFVVAADEGWMPQSEEHLVALRTLGVRHGLLVVTRSDRADPGPALAGARERLAWAGLGAAESVVVSGRTGAGLGDLRGALDRLVATLPAPDPGAPVRLWIDRAFTVRGSGTVVTGTLPAGRVEVGDELLLDGEPVRVRGLESLKEPVASVTAVARVAVNLRGRVRAERGRALVTPGAWTATELIDVRLSPAGAERGEGGEEDERLALPPRLTAHIGSTAVVCEVRPLGPGAARLRLARPLPLHLGDVLLLRDPGRDPGRDPARETAREIARDIGRDSGRTYGDALRVIAGARVLDTRPPELRRRGAARERAAALAAAAPDAASALRAHRLLRGGTLVAMGCPPSGSPVAADWYADPGYWAELAARLPEVVRRHAEANPLEPGMPLEAVRHELGLPDRRLVAALVRPPLEIADGRVLAARPGLPGPVAQAVRRLAAELTDRPFLAPDAGRLADLGLGPRELAAAVRAGGLLRIADGVVLLPGADERAAALLARLPQPFTVSQARTALDTSRRVAVPLLEHLDRRGMTERVDDVHRRCVAAGPQG